MKGVHWQFLLALEKARLGFFSFFNLCAKLN